MTHLTDRPEASFPQVPTLMAQAAALTEAAFAARYPGHYLVTEAIHRDDAAWRNFKTSVVSSLRVGQLRAALSVEPVEKRDQTNPYSWMITIGRTRNNDIVLSDVSISKLHAWVRRRPEDESPDGLPHFTVTDAGSRNGTFVNGVALRGDTGALPLSAHLRLGQVELLFVDGRLLYQAMRRPRVELAGSSAGPAA